MIEFRRQRDKVKTKCGCEKIYYCPLMLHGTENTTCHKFKKRKNKRVRDAGKPHTQTHARMLYYL